MAPQKDYKWLLNTILGAVLIALATYFGYSLVQSNPSPQPSPTASATPSPAPSVTPAPVPSPTPTSSATPSSKVSFIGMDNPLLASTVPASSGAVNIARNEVRGFFVRSADCSASTVVAPAGITVALYRPTVITTTSKSYTGAAIGAYYDPLVAMKAGDCGSGDVWVDISVASTVAAGSYVVKLGDLSVAVRVNALVMPAKPSFPMYAGLQPYRLLQGHKLPGTTGVDVQGALIKKYVDMLRAHRIEPYGQSPATPPVVSGKLNLDNWKDLGGSFRQLVIDGAIAPVVLATFSDNGSTAFLQAANATIAAEPALAGAWYYLQDEPQTADLAGVVTKLQAVRTNAPLLQTMVTHEPWDAAVGLLDHPTPAFQLWKADARFPSQFVYGACPAHGSCANGYLAAATGIPDLMIDQPTIHPRMFPIMAMALNAKASLYYAVNEGYGQIDPWTNLYLFGGNGDGTLMFPGITGERGFTENVPVASLRMKMIRQGVYDMEYLKLLPAATWKAAIPGPTGWAKTHAAIEALRAQATP